MKSPFPKIDNLLLSLATALLFCVVGLLVGGFVDSVVTSTISAKETHLNALAPTSLDDLNLNIPCEIVKVYDGDTVTVQFTFESRVRIIGCWAHEIKTKNLRAKKLGIESKEHLQKFCEGSKGVLVLPLGQIRRLGDTTSMGRLLADIWVNDSWISDYQNSAGMAYTTKEDLTNSLHPVAAGKETAN